MASLWGWLILVLVAQPPGTAHAAKILGVCPMPSRSHHMVITSLLKQLAVRGHEVTVISSYPEEKPQANYTNIDIKFNMQTLLKKGKNTFEIAKTNPFALPPHILGMGEKISKHVLENEIVQEMIMSKKNQFDIVILEDFGNEALAGLAHTFSAHLIYFSSGVGFVWTNDFVGNPSCSAYIPSIFTSFNNRMTFTERMQNAIYNLFADLYYHLYFIPRQDALMKENLKGITDLPHLSEINARTSLVLTYAVPGINYPQPLLPNLVQVGGVHIKPSKPLSEDLQTFMDSAPEGVVYFSMGSLIKSADFPLQIRESILKAFGKLKQKVLWKFEVDNMSGHPSNVLIKNWFPQNDILGHPNTRLFITHGGLLSSLEAIYHGVPLIGIPILGDQRLNMKHAESLGYGIILEMSNITEKSLDWTLKEALSTPRYKDRAKVVSRIFHDQPHTPMERAVYWTEYVLRHKGAPHLRSAAMDLTWYQYLLLDVIAAMLLLVLTVVSVVLLTCRKLFCSRKSKTVSPDKKNK